MSVWKLPSDRNLSLYYDGERAGGKPVAVELHGSKLLIREGEVETWHDLGSAAVKEPVGRGPWTLTFADGSHVSTSDPEISEQLASSFGGSGIVRYLESKWHWAATAVIVTVAAMWGLLTFGLPAAAKSIAMALPPTVSASISSQSLELMDELVFEPSQLKESEQARIEKLFSEIVATNPDYQAYELVFRSSNIGPNAFAVPGGIVLMTDELVELAKNDNELIAVLAHEVGHLSGRHSLRMVLQNSIGAVLIATLTGDLTNITAVSAAIPTVLLQAKYSRDFEREADEFAFEYMRQRGLPTDALSDFLMRLEADAGGEGVPEWFSTHPASSSRRDTE